MSSDTGVNPAQQTSIKNTQALVTMFGQLGYTKVEARDNMIAMDGSGSNNIIDFSKENPARVGDFGVWVYRTLQLPAPLPPDTASTYQGMNAGLLVAKVHRESNDPQGLTRSLFEGIYSQPEWNQEQRDLAYQSYLSQVTAPLVVPFLNTIYGAV